MIILSSISRSRRASAATERLKAALVHGSRALGEPRATSWPSWRRQVHDLDMKSSVHPKYKTKYHVGNWPAYDRALVQRGDITVWLAPWNWPALAIPPSSVGRTFPGACSSSPDAEGVIQPRKSLTMLGLSTT